MTGGPVAADTTPDMAKQNGAVLQSFALTIPPDVPPGQCVWAAGIYETPREPRLAITAPLPQPCEYHELREIRMR